MMHQAFPGGTVKFIQIPKGHQVKVRIHFYLRSVRPSTPCNGSRYQCPPKKANKWRGRKRTLWINYDPNTVFFW